MVFGDPCEKINQSPKGWWPPGWEPLVWRLASSGLDGLCSRLGTKLLQRSYLESGILWQRALGFPVSVQAVLIRSALFCLWREREGGGGREQELVTVQVYVVCVEWGGQLNFYLMGQSPTNPKGTWESISLASRCLQEEEQVEGPVRIL
jgi:hypothetical protein